MEQLSWRYTVRENVVVFCCKVENVYVAVFLLQSRPGQVQFDSNKQILHLAQPKLLTKVVFKSSSFLMPLLGCTLSLNLNKKNTFFNSKRVQMASPKLRFFSKSSFYAQLFSLNTTASQKTR